MAGAACAANAACAALLLVGECCPTLDGVQLECCAVPQQSAIVTPPPAIVEVRAPPPPAISPSPDPPAASPDPPGPPLPPTAPGTALLDSEPLGSSDTAGFSTAEPHQQPPSKIWGSQPKTPLPTNRWWINLVLPDGETVGENVVATLPYLMKAMSDGLHVCLPSKDATPTYVALPFEDTLAFGAHELGRTTAATHTIVSHDALSVSVAWEVGGSPGAQMLTPLVRGMAYATAEYKKMTPTVSFATSPILKVNGKPPDAMGPLMAARFELQLGNGQTWLLYADKVVEVSVEGPSLKFASKYDGTLRAAVATADTSALLDAYATRVPLGGHVQATAHGDRATLTFEFAARGEGELLMMALPHHLDVGHLSGVKRTKMKHSTLKGEMLGVVGDTWLINEPLPTIEWGAPRPIDPSRKDAIIAALALDAEKPMLVPDPYGAGKEMGAVGRLALIADELGEADTATALRKRLAAQLEEWLTGGGADPLVYEPTYGGLCSANGLADKAADFGGGWYNDHHFHYGYFLYAAAAVGRKDPKWLAKWAPSIGHLVRDIANPSCTDELYPQHRFKDWYVGHSWASGIFPSASGRNQESVSEALNAWYGLALYGMALGDASLRDLGRVMLATEMRSGFKYWQIEKQSDTYPSAFAKNGLAAVVWSTKVDKTTWFGSNVEYAYGIQAMPVTPITELWLRPEWLADTQTVWGPAMDTATEQWRGILLMMAAINQPADAWKNANLLTLFDNGNSKTNVLYWIATRPSDPSDRSDAPPAIVAEPPAPPLVITKHPHTDATTEEPPSSSPTDEAPAADSTVSDADSGGFFSNWIANIVGGAVVIGIVAVAGGRWRDMQRAADAAAPTDTPYRAI